MHEVTRYGATYAVDSIRLDELFTSGHVPIIHMGQITGIDTLQKYGHNWLEAVWPSPYHAGLARQRLRRLLDLRAFPPCCCPLAVSRPGKAGGPEVTSFRTSAPCGGDLAPS